MLSMGEQPGRNKTEKARDIKNLADKRRINNNIMREMINNWRNQRKIFSSHVSETSQISLGEVSYHSTNCSSLLGGSQGTISHKWIFLLVSIWPARFSFKTIMIDFMCKLDWVKGCSAGKTLFLGGPVTCTGVSERDQHLILQTK